MSMGARAFDQIGDSSLAELPQRCVGGESSTTARVFGVPVDLVAGVFGVGKVDSPMRHGCAVRRGICDEGIAAVVGDVEPFVAVRGPGIRLVCAFEEVGGL